MELCAVNLTEVHSPALCNDRSNAAWLEYKGGCSPGDGLEFGDQINAFEQMHRGDHLIFEHPTNATSWNEQCIQKLNSQPSVFFELKDPWVRWRCRANLDW